jgi:hypothetical protein
MEKEPAKNKNRFVDVTILIFVLIVQALLVAQLLINLMDMPK